MELDISQSPDGKKWSVKHSDEYSAEPVRQLARYLAELMQWSNDNPDHDVMTVHIDLRHVNEQFNTFSPDALDQYIKSNFDPAKIYCPGDLMENRATLPSYGAKINGWPKLHDLD